ncbi:nuclear transport factor 2 family protein [Arenibacter echinorum]|uniref:SnoaL-like protein n=1 Tax=Arenibacter echinorum TaxID=440515 RepID=A0A327R0V3_9FLAO|nr:nuclear transport factor 2 family protein [Arenibacter echinorum]RAJ10250.1 hypothetical protein LV92_02999 [Arenibacter echinorum]
MKKIFKIIIIGFYISNLGCSSTNVPKGSNIDNSVLSLSRKMVSTEETSKVLIHHLTAFGENNLVSIMSDYTDESIVVTPNATFKGLDQIEAFYVTLFAKLPSNDTQFEMNRKVIENELAYIVWYAKSRTVEISLGSDTLVVYDGKIKLHTFAGDITTIF